MTDTKDKKYTSTQTLTDVVNRLPIDLRTFCQEYWGMWEYVATNDISKTVNDMRNTFGIVDPILEIASMNMINFNSKVGFTYFRNIDDVDTLYIFVGFRHRIVRLNTSYPKMKLTIVNQTTINSEMFANFNMILLPDCLVTPFMDCLNMTTQWVDLKLQLDHEK